MSGTCCRFQDGESVVIICNGIRGALIYKVSGAVFVPPNSFGIQGVKKQIIALDNGWHYRLTNPSGNVMVGVISERYLSKSSLGEEVEKIDWMKMCNINVGSSDSI